MVMRKPENLRVTITAFSLTPGDNSGAPMTAEYTLPPLGPRADLHPAQYRGDVLAALFAHELAVLIPGDPDSAAYRFTPKVTAQDWQPGESLSCTESDSAADVGVLMYAPGTVATVGDAMFALMPGKTAVYIPDGDLWATPYVPAYPTADFLETLRNIVSGLGCPIVQLGGFYILLPTIDRMLTPRMSDFTVHSDAPVPQQETTLQWYETLALDDTIWNVIYQATDVISIGAGETQEVSVQMDGTPGILDGTLTCLDSVTPFPYDGSKGSIYTVTGSDGYRVSAARWRAGGGSIVARRGNGPHELILTVTGPDDPSLAPYTITESDDRPALYVASKGGVRFNVKQTTVAVGSPAPENNAVVPDPAVLDMPYVDTEERAYTAAYRAARALTGTQLTAVGVLLPDVAHANGTTVQGVSIPMLLAKKFYAQHHFWRFVSIEWDEVAGQVRFSADEHTTFADLTDEYGTGTTFGAFKDKYTAYLNPEDGITFGDLARDPLVAGSFERNG